MTRTSVPVLTLLGLIMPSVAVAQLVSGPTPQTASVCAKIPAEPAILQNMDGRDANRVLFLRDMYRAYTFNDIVETGKCSCKQRYPAWEPVVEYYLEHYSRIKDRHELRENAEPYHNTINNYRAAARNICIASGTWK